MAAFEQNAHDAAARREASSRWASRPASSSTRASCRPTATPARAHRGLGRVPRALPGREAARAGRPLHGLRHPLLPHRARCIAGMATRLPDQQPDPRVERPRLPRPLARGARPPAQDQQLPGVHRPRLPGALRGLVRARHQRAAGDDQEHRVRDRRQGLRRGLDRAASRRRSAPARRSRSSAPGPAGLACAAQLNRAGHLVTVFERADRIGGLLMYGIPNMKLDKGVVERRVDADGGRGRHVRHRAPRSARDVPADELQAEFDAVVLCGGATAAARPPGRGPRPRRASTSRWSSCTRTRRACSTANLQDGAYISAPRTRTSSSSAAATPAPTASARRCATAAGASCSSRSCRSRRDERAPDNPWPQWPKVYRLDYGQEEAAALFGADPRHFCDPDASASSATAAAA